MERWTSLTQRTQGNGQVDDEHVANEQERVESQNGNVRMSNHHAFKGNIGVNETSPGNLNNNSKHVFVMDLKSQ